MKNLLSLLLLAFAPMMVSAQTYPIAIDEANFPDANFRKYLLAQDYGKDGVLTEEEINGIKDLSIGRAGIGNLKGIEYFKELTVLACYGNQLTALDVSKNTKLTHMNCYINCLTTLDVSKNTALTYLGCSQNGIKGTAMDALISGLPKKTADQDCTLEIYDDSDEDEGNECSAGQVAAIKAKGWIPMFFNGTEWENF